MWNVHIFKTSTLSSRNLANHFASEFMNQNAFVASLNSQIELSSETNEKKILWILRPKKKMQQYLSLNWNSNKNFYIENVMSNDHDKILTTKICLTICVLHESMWILHLSQYNMWVYICVSGRTKMNVKTKRKKNEIVHLQ